MEIDVGPRFESAVRSMMNFVGGGLMWMGLAQCLPSARAAIRAADPSQLPMAPLSRAERAEWAALVERLR